MHEQAKINEEKEWFYSSKAFKLAQEYILDNWTETKSGKWVNKKELEEDAAMSFEDLLAEMKAADALASPTQNPNPNPTPEQLPEQPQNQTNR